MNYYIILLLSYIINVSNGYNLLLIEDNKTVIHLFYDYNVNETYYNISKKNDYNHNINYYDNQILNSYQFISLIKKVQL